MNDWLESQRQQVEEATRELLAKVRGWLEVQLQLAQSHARAFAMMSPRATLLLLVLMTLSFVLAQLGLADPVIPLSKWFDTNIWWHGITRMFFVAWVLYLSGFVVQTDVTHTLMYGERDAEQRTGNRGVFAVVLAASTIIVGWLTLPPLLVLLATFGLIAAFVLPNTDEVGRRILVPASQMILLIVAMWTVMVG